MSCVSSKCPACFRCRLAVKTGLTDNGRIEVIAGLSEKTPVVGSTKGVPPLRTAVQPQMVGENS
jgi:hypothetical protein